VSNDQRRKHVLADLQPYVCTYPDCDLLEHFFENREEWYQHENQQHRVDFFCNVESHQRFTERDNFLEHMELEHSTKFNAAQLPLLFSMFQSPSQIQGGKCHLCLSFTGKLKSHISRHLEQIALFALPRANETAGDGKESKNSNLSARNVNGSIDRDRPQTKSKRSRGSWSTPQSDQSPLVNAQELPSSEPDIDDPVHQVTVPEGEDPSWDLIVDKFSDARKDLPQKDVDTHLYEKVREEVAKVKEEAEKKADEEKRAAEEAKAKTMALSAPIDKRKPIYFKDAVGRKFSFPFHLCQTWAVSHIPNSIMYFIADQFPRVWRNSLDKHFCMWRSLDHM
jgi:hypothetical protein